MPPKDTDETLLEIRDTLREIKWELKTLEEIAPFFRDTPGQNTLPSRLSNVETAYMELIARIKRLEEKKDALQTASVSGRAIVWAAVFTGIFGMMVAALSLAAQFLQHKPP